MNEKLKPHVIGGMQRLAAGALGVGVSLATKDPMVGMAASAVAMTATDYMKSKLSADNSELVVAEEHVLLDYCAQLDERVRRIEERLVDTGQRLDRQDLLSKEVTFSRFAKGLGEAATVEKREALVHATAYQFDPRRGAPAMRDYWLRRVRETSDAELALVLLLLEHEAVTFHHHLVFKVPLVPNSDASSDVLPVPEHDAIALESIANQIAAGGPGKLVHSVGGRNVRPPNGRASAGPAAFALTADGRILVSFCKDD